jgi:hypothetical protein
MTYPVRSSQATMKPATKQPRVRMSVMARSAGDSRPAVAEEAANGLPRRLAADFRVPGHHDEVDG